MLNGLNDEFDAEHERSGAFCDFPFPFLLPLC